MNLWPARGLSRDDRDKTKRLSAESKQSSSPFLPPTLASKKQKSGNHQRSISLRLDMKWAHIINISIQFDCPPNKSHCSNKQKAPLLCLLSSGFELSMLQLPIYYRHLSQVTDKHCDGCRIWLCQNGFISPFQATISGQLMSSAHSSSPLLFFFLSLSPQVATAVSIIFWRTSFTCINGHHYLPICLCMDSVDSHTLSSLFSLYLCVFISASAHMLMILQARTYVQEHVFFFVFCIFPDWYCSAFLFDSLDAIACYLENSTINHLNCCWQTSKHFRHPARFLPISNTQVDVHTKEQKLQNDVCVSECRWTLAEMSSFWAKRQNVTYLALRLMFI